MGARHIVAFLAIAALAGGAWPMPGAAESSTPDFLELTDPAGDVDMQPAAEPAPTGLADLVDLRAFRLDQEDGYGWRITWRLEVAPLDFVYGSVDLGRFGLVLKATVDQDYELQALVTGRVVLNPAPGSPRVGANVETACLGARLPTSCEKARTEAKPVVSGHEISLTVPKSYLRPKTNAQTRGLLPGATVHAIQVDSWFEDTTKEIAHSDHAERSGAEYVLRVRAMGRELVLSMEGEETNTQGMAPGPPGPDIRGPPVPMGQRSWHHVTATNWQRVDRLILLEYATPDEARLLLGGPRAVWVPAQESRVVPFWVEAPVLPESKRYNHGNITAVIADDSEAGARILLDFHAMDAIDLANPVLWLHTVSPGGRPVWSPLRSGTSFGTDAPYHVETWVRPDASGHVRGYQGQVEVRGDTVVSQPLLMGLGGRATGKFTWISNAAFPGAHVTMFAEFSGPGLSSRHDALLMDRDVDFLEGSNEITFSATPYTVLLGRGAGVTFRIDVSIPVGPQVPDIFLKMDGASSITLPLEADPGALDLEMAGPFRMDLEGNARPLVNPGEWHEIRVRLWNLDAEPHEVRLSQLVDDSRWETWLRPGAAFKIPGGRVITVYALARAPLEAQEGEGANWTLALDGGSGEHLERRLRPTVVTKADVPNDVTKDHDDAAAQEALIPDKEPSAVPAPSLAVLGMILIAGVMRRRRPT